MNKLFNNLPKVVAWIATSFSSKEGGSVPVGLCIKLIARFQPFIKSHGPIWTLGYIKNVRTSLLSYLSGSKVRVPGVAVTGDGIPKILGDLIPLVRARSYLVISLILTILYSTRSLKLGGPVNTDSITQPFTGDVTNLSMFVGSFWRDLGYRPATASVPKVLTTKFESYRSKSGPNGHALKDALSDARALPKSLIESLTEMSGPRMGFLIKTAANELTGTFLSGILKGLKDKSSFRRLSSFFDKENKVRVIGILDWYSQLALKPLHRYLANTLKKIRQDCTFDQSNYQKSLKGSKIYYSVDLSSATDRFPISLIELLLKAQLPASYVDA